MVYNIPVELDPNIQQKKLLSAAMGARRKGWNTAMGWIEKRLVNPNAFDLTNHHNEVKDVDIPWWREVSKHCFESAFADLAQASPNCWIPRSVSKDGVIT